MNLENLDKDEQDTEGHRVWGANYVAQETQHWRDQSRRGADGQGIKVALSNSFGFGGTNASLCFGRWDDEH